MMKNRMLGVSALAMTTTVAIAGCSAGGVVDGDTGAGESQDISVAIYAPEGSSLSQTIAWWADEVTEATDGAVEFTLNYDASLLAADDTLQGIADGRADMGLIGAIYYESQLPLTSITSVPYLVDNPKAALLALSDLSASSDAMAQEYSSNGIVPMFFLPARDALLGSSDEMITDTDDLAGRSIRAAGTFSTSLAAVGANPVSIVFNELYESLDRGVVDSYSGILLDSVETAGLYEVADFVSDPQQGLLTTYPVSINADVWDSLSDDVKSVMEEKSAEAVDEYFSLEDTAYASACDVIEESGGEVYVWSDDAAAGWADALGDTIMDGWRDRAGDDADEFEASYMAAMDEFAADGMPNNGVEECAARF